MSLLIIPSTHPTQWETTKPKNEPRFLTGAGDETRTPIVKVGCRYVWWTGHDYSVSKQYAHKRFRALVDAIRYAQSL